tara:strand:+ start:2003 stop:2635 length:633 start_codon:yes stop_codon:yes gene_type:complete
MTGEISLRLIENTPEIQKKIMNLLAKEMSEQLKKSIGKIQSDIRPIAKAAIEGCPEALSLRGGTLRLDFGITGDPAADIATIVSNAIFVTNKPVKATANNFTGGITINMQPLDYSELLALPAGSQTTEKGAVLPWLDWLLNLGDAIVIADFGVEYGPHGRTGGAHMTTKERPFKVDTQYSGTAENNFVTRALEGAQKQINDVIISSIKRT